MKKPTKEDEIRALKNELELTKAELTRAKEDVKRAEREREEHRKDSNGLRHQIHALTVENAEMRGYLKRMSDEATPPPPKPPVYQDHQTPVIGGYGNQKTWYER